KSFACGNFSNAINWYAAEKFPQAKLLPSSIEGRASTARWLFFQAAHLTPASLPIIRATHPQFLKMFPIPPDPSAVEGPQGAAEVLSRPRGAPRRSRLPRGRLLPGRHRLRAAHRAAGRRGL